MGMQGGDAEAIVAMISGLIKKVEDEGKQAEIEAKVRGERGEMGGEKDE